MLSNASAITSLWVGVVRMNMPGGVENRQTQIPRRRRRCLLQGGAHAIEPEFLAITFRLNDTDGNDQQSRSGI